MHFLFLAYLSFTLRTVCNKEYTRRFSKTETNLFFNAIGLSITCLISALGGGIQAPGSLVLGWRPYLALFSLPPYILCW